MASEKDKIKNLLEKAIIIVFILSWIILFIGFILFGYEVLNNDKIEYDNTTVFDNCTYSGTNVTYQEWIFNENGTEIVETRNTSSDIKIYEC